MNDDHDQSTPIASRAQVVGYRNPPYEHRWSPGQSGNPRGRPRKRRTVKDEVNDALLSRVTVQDNGKAVSMTMQALIIRNVVRDAAKRSLPAVRLIIALIDRYGLSHDAVLDTADLEAADRAILDSYIANLAPSPSEPTPEDQS